MMKRSERHYWSSLMFEVSASNEKKSKDPSLSGEERLSHATSAEQSKLIATKVFEMENMNAEFDQISEYALGSEQVKSLNEEAIKRGKLNPTVKRNPLCDGS